jgi:hypothetical protein
MDRLRKIEREHEYMRNQNAHFKTLVDNYEQKYTELKKYCLKIESAYSKFLTAKKKGSHSDTDFENDK